MQNLWISTTETVNLGVVSGLDVLYVDVLESTHSFRMVSQIGARRPLHCTALGKAMLAFLSPSEREGAIGSLRLEKFAPQTISSAASLRKELKKVAEQGYAVDDEEACVGSRCVACPIFDQSGKMAGALVYRARSAASIDNGCSPSADRYAKARNSSPTISATRSPRQGWRARAEPVCPVAALSRVASGRWRPSTELLHDRAPGSHKFPAWFPGPWPARYRAPSLCR